MPDNRMRYKAGKISFLLVCLFLCTACKKQQAVFEAAKEPEQVGVKAETLESAEEPEEALVRPEEDFKAQQVNINTADEGELMTLPGIGRVRAASIIEYRRENGSFEKIEDIMKVKGIKNGIFSKISSLICVK